MVSAGRWLRVRGAITGCVTGLLAIAFTGCDRPETDAPEVESPIATEGRDSAGIRIIENARPPDGSRLDWRIGLEPAVSIGKREGEDPYLLNLVFGATRLRDGRIVIANGGSSELRFFDSLGNHLANRGGAGEGPGEFASLAAIEPWPGDSIAAWDAPRLGFSVFDTDGSFGRTFTLISVNPPSLRQSRASATPNTPPAGHQGESVPRDIPAPGVLWMPVSAMRDGGILAIAVGGDESTTVVQIRDDEGGVLSSPLTHTGWEPMLLSQAYAGEPVVEPWGDLVILTSTQRYELKAFARGGTLARIVRREHELRAPTEAEVFAYMEERSPAGMSPEQIRRQFQSLSVPEHFPAFGKVMTDAAGHLWVREYDLPGDERPAPLWTVFNAEGRVLGFVETPKGLGIYEIGEDYILGRVRDELQVRIRAAVVVGAVRFLSRIHGRPRVRTTMEDIGMKRSRTWGLVAASGLVAITSCEPRADTEAAESDAPAALRHEIHDSAGIPIVENRAPAPGSRLGWVIGDEPVVSIGTRDASDAFQFYRVGDATRLADGRIVVANGGSNELLVFDADGNHLDAWAGQGDGPGEFWDLTTVRPWPGDSLIAGDSQQGRASIFDLAGAHGRTMSLRGPPDAITREMAAAGQAADAGPVDIEPHIVLRVLPDGTLLTRTPRGYTQGFYRGESSYALMAANGSIRASLGDYLGTETFSAFYPQDDRTVAVIALRHPFGKATLTTAWGDLAAIGDNETYEIRAYRGDGSPARIVRRDRETRIPTQAEQDEAFRDRFAGLSEEDREPRMAVAADVPLVEGFPAYSRLRSDALGHLWVAEFKLPDAPYEGSLWTVFDGEGRALGFVETPAGLSIFEIGEDYILGSTTDELGVEYVQLRELGRSNS